MVYKWRLHDVMAAIDPFRPEGPDQVSDAHIAKLEAVAEAASTFLGFLDTPVIGSKHEDHLLWDAEMDRLGDILRSAISRLKEAP